MHISRVDLNLFVVFDAIYAEGSITRASQRLNLTQPAVSHALRRLRQTFEDPLFERRGHTMIPTPLARQAVATVREALQRREITLNKANRFDPATATKRFTVGMRNHLEPAVLPSLIPARELCVSQVAGACLRGAGSALASAAKERGQYLFRRIGSYNG